MIRGSLVVLVAFIASISDTQACSIGLPPIERITDDVAAHGVMIKGRLIQAFDTVKQKPEIIQADEIYIGRTEPKKFVIYRSKADYDFMRKARHDFGIMCPRLGYDLKLGHVFDRLILVPAKGTDPSVNGRWSFTFYDGSFWSQENLDLLIDKAKSQNRFQSTPPP